MSSDNNCGAPFKPETDIPPLTGKVILVTGGNTGLGFASLQLLTTNGVRAKIYIGARSQNKAQEAIDKLKAAAPWADLHFVQMDLMDLDSVNAAAETIKRENSRLDILVNNAGIMAHGPELTKNGYEKQFGTNHVGHFLLTRQLLPLLLKTAAEPRSDVRIINLTSDLHTAAPPGGFLPEAATTTMEAYGTRQRYGMSKLANIQHAFELARRYPQITSVAIHPGVASTTLTGEFRKNHPMIGKVMGPLMAVAATDPLKAAQGQTWAIIADVEGKPLTGTRCGKKLVSGTYYKPVAKSGGESPDANNKELAKKLYDWSDEEMAKKGYVAVDM